MTQMKAISVKCPGCGAGLQVAPNVDHFGCGYCGTAVRVVREGGTVSLVTEVLSKIQMGTDKTAAELALLRLRGEHEAVSVALADLEIPPEQRLAPFVGRQFDWKLGAGLLVAGLIFADYSHYISILCSILLIAILDFGRRTKNKDTERLHEEIGGAKIEARRQEIIRVTAQREKLISERDSIRKQIAKNEAIVRHP